MESRQSFKISPSKSFVFLPFSVILLPRYKPLPSISISSRSLTLRFKLLAKPSAAFVGLPFLSKAIFFGGPIIIFYPFLAVDSPSFPYLQDKRSTGLWRDSLPSQYKRSFPLRLWLPLHPVN